MQHEIEKKRSQTENVLASAKAFFSGTLLSRVSGMFRDIALAMLFGTGQFLASFMVAFRFANLFRRLFAESALSSCFVPLLEKKRKESEKHSVLFFRDTFALMVLVGIVVTLFLEALCFFSSPLLKGSSFFEIIPLIHIMLPSLVFLMLYGLFSAYLQCRGIYFIGAVAPVSFNIIWCAFAFFAHAQPNLLAMKILSWGVNIAFFSQLLLTALVTMKALSKALTRKEMFSSFALKSSAKELFKPYVLGMIGISAVQLNSFFDSIFAKVADGSGPAYLWYAIRVQQVPLSLFSIALASALLPTLSRLIKQDNLIDFQKTLQTTLKKNILLLSFSSFGLFVLGFMALRLIFFRGAFNELSLSMTLKCLWGYALGLVFQGSVIVLSQAFYAREDFKTPVKASTMSVALNIFCNALFVFVFELGAVSIALATSAASFFQYVYLHFMSLKKVPMKLLSFSIRSIVISCIAALCALMFCSSISDPSFLSFTTFGSVESVLSFSKTALNFIFAALIFTGSFFLCAKILSVKEAFILFKRRSHK